jgi:hypothetical protein
VSFAGLDDAIAVDGGCDDEGADCVLGRPVGFATGCGLVGAPPPEGSTVRPITKVFGITERTVAPAIVAEPETKLFPAVSAGEPFGAVFVAVEAALPVGALEVTVVAEGPVAVEVPLGDELPPALEGVPDDPVLDVPAVLAAEPTAAVVLLFPVEVAAVPVPVAPDDEALLEFCAPVLSATVALLASTMLTERIMELVNGLAPGRWFTTLTTI